MSMVPHEENELVVQRTDLEPFNRKDARSIWETFLDGIRATIGLKPLYLAERWAEAKVRQEEADATARLMEAKAKYELAAAEARKLQLEAEAAYAKGMAEADRIQIQNSLLAKASNPLAAELLAAGTRDAREAFEYMNRVIQQIEMHGGVVEIELPTSDEGGTNS